MLALHGRGAERELQLQFLRTPLELLPRDDKSDEVGAVKLERNKLEAKGDGSQRAIGTGEFEVVPVRSLPVCKESQVVTSLYTARTSNPLAKTGAFINTAHPGQSLVRH